MQHFDDTPDETRPQNPWPRLLALGAVLLLSVFAVGACLVAFVNTGAEPELRLTVAEIEPGVPRFEPVTRWGADSEGFTYGAWIVQTPRSGTEAFFSRNVQSGCNVQWLATEQVAGVTGVFRDRCDGSSFSIDGTPLDRPAARHLDHFEVEVSEGEVVVNVRTVQIGDCLELAATGMICASTGPITRTIPLTRSIPAEFGRR
jgi:hypothetical protein